jgi:hypothetical protein
MKYSFNYFFDEEEKEMIIDADTDREAVLKFFEKVGICEFGCIKKDGTYFTDNDYKHEKELIVKGC